MTLESQKPDAAAEANTMPAQPKRHDDLPDTPSQTVNVFDRRHHPTPGTPVVLDDLDAPGHYVARYAGNLELSGHGATQLNALADLERQDAERQKLTRLEAIDAARNR